MGTHGVTYSYTHILTIPPQHCLLGAPRQRSPHVEGITVSATPRIGSRTTTVLKSHNSVCLEDDNVVFMTQHSSDGTLRATRLPVFCIRVFGGFCLP